MSTANRPDRTFLEELKFDLVGGVGAFLHLAWMTSLRWKHVDMHHAFDAQKRYGHVILAFWHGQLLMPAYVGRNGNIHVLISESDDGEYIARLVSHLGFKAVRGSATRGGRAAFRKLIRAAKEFDIGVTPDGPLGPRHKVQAGTITLARATGLPLLPVASAARWCRRVSSWDRFEIPLPGSEAAIVFGEPILVGADAGAEERCQKQVRLESVLNVLTNRARAAVGLPPESPELSG